MVKKKFYFRKIALKIVPFFQNAFFPISQYAWLYCLMGWKNFYFCPITHWLFMEATYQLFLPDIFAIASLKALIGTKNDLCNYIYLSLFEIMNIHLCFAYVHLLKFHFFRVIFVLWLFYRLKNSFGLFFFNNI